MRQHQLLQLRQTFKHHRKQTGNDVVAEIQNAQSMQTIEHLRLKVTDLVVTEVEKLELSEGNESPRIYHRYPVPLQSYLLQLPESKEHVLTERFQMVIAQVQRIHTVCPSKKTSTDAFQSVVGQIDGSKVDQRLEDSMRQFRNVVLTDTEGLQSMFQPGERLPAEREVHSEIVLPEFDPMRRCQTEGTGSNKLDPVSAEVDGRVTEIVEVISRRLLEELWDPGQVPVYAGNIRTRAEACIRFGRTETGEGRHHWDPVRSTRLLQQNEINQRYSRKHCINKIESKSSLDRYYLLSTIRPIMPTLL